MTTARLGMTEEGFAHMREIGVFDDAGRIDMQAVAAHRRELENEYFAETEHCSLSHMPMQWFDQHVARAVLNLALMRLDAGEDDLRWAMDCVDSIDSWCLYERSKLLHDVAEAYRKCADEIRSSNSRAEALVWENSVDPLGAGGDAPCGEPAPTEAPPSLN